MKNFFYLFLFCSGSHSHLFAQIDSLQTLKLDAVEVSVTRFKHSINTSTWSVSRLNFKESQDQMQQLYFSDYLNGVPGLLTQNSNNFSQDLRISIRGFGSRSAFGIRGIKLMVDGIPETTPDGQGQIDNLSLGSIESVEVIRGPSSILYGNASGGVISIQTPSELDQNYFKTGIIMGAYGMQNIQIRTGVKNDKTSLILLANKIKTNGYRIHSGFESSGLNARVKHRFNSKSELNFLLNFTDSPIAQDAGSLNLEETQTKRIQARDRNIQFMTQESVKQFKSGLSFSQKWSSKLFFSTYGFYATRAFNTSLPFEFGGQVELDRLYFGQGAQLSFQGGTSVQHQVQLGYSWASQSDYRKRFMNNQGLRGDLTLDQDENFDALGFYIMDELSSGNFKIVAGIRYDINTLEALDRFLANGNDSGSLSLNAWSSSLGINYQLSQNQYFFASYRTSFETPVLSELSANPKGVGGFNTDLSAQKAKNTEFGFRSLGKKSQLEVILFNIQTKNDLVPYELESFPDRNFYRNSGETKRRGLEVTYSLKRSTFLETKISYTYSDFTYKSFEKPNGDFGGNQLPGIPKHLVFVQTNFTKGNWKIIFNSRFQSSLYADDANKVKEDYFLLSSLNMSYGIKRGSVLWIPFMGINNLWNSIYNDNIRINAFGGRYYEPAPTRHIYGGVRLNL